MNQQGLCTLSCIPVRAEASDAAEQVNQLLMGEPYSVLEEQPKWLRIAGLLDNYEGWIDRGQHTALEEEILEADLFGFPRSSSLLGQAIHAKTRKRRWVPMGAVLPKLEDNRFALADELWEFSGELASNDPRWISSYALQYLDCPYLWGGRTAMGIDCSGFTQTVYSLCGAQLPRDASQQFNEGISVEFAHRKDADLAFFANEKGRITHVGILLPNNKIIHASGRVRIDELDEKGIFRKAENRYTHNLTGVKRIF